MSPAVSERHTCYRCAVHDVQGPFRDQGDKDAPALESLETTASENGDEVFFTSGYSAREIGPEAREGNGGPSLCQYDLPKDQTAGSYRVGVLRCCEEPGLHTTRARSMAREGLPRLLAASLSENRKERNALSNWGGPLGERIVLDYIKTLRRMIGNTKIIVPGVRALIFNDRRELLLQKQALFGSWALPHGCVDVGESVFDALKREVKEETGLSVIEAKPFGIYSDPKYSVTYPNGDSVQTFTVAFLVREWASDLAIDGDEVLDLEFFPLDRLPEPIYPIHLDTILDYRSGDGTFVLK